MNSCSCFVHFIFYSSREYRLRAFICKHLETRHLWASNLTTGSVQLILSTFLHIHTAPQKPLYIRLTSSFLIVQVSVPYSVTLHTSALTILFLMSLFNPPLNNFFLLVNASFPIAIVFLISLWYFASLDTRLSK